MFLTSFVLKSNQFKSFNSLKSGIYGVSNALLDTPWPKVEKLKEEFSQTIESRFNHTELLNLLEDESLAEDSKLPNTGVPYDLEKMLSAIHIKSERYGTCCSTVLTISRDGEVRFTEKSYPVGDRKEGVVSFNFQI